MGWQYTPEILPYIAVLLLSMLSAGGLAVYTAAFRTDATTEPTVRAFVWLNAGCAVWSGAYALQLASTDVPAKRLWLGVAFVGAAVVALSCFSFAVAYAGEATRLSRRTLLALAIEPAVAFALFATGYRGLYERPVETAVVADLVVLERTFGPMAVVHVCYLYGLLAVGAGLLLKAVYQSQHVYRGQASAMLIGILVPLVANVVWFLGLGPLGTIDFTPVAFTVSGLAFAVAIYRHDLLDIAPVARTAVVENMREGFLVIDATDRIRDANEAARRWRSNAEIDSIVGRDVTDVFPALAPIVRDEATGDRTDVVVQGDDGPRFFDVRIQRLSDPGGIRLLLLRDVTERHAVERRYQSLIENASDLITVLDADGAIRYQSPSIASGLGYEPSEVAGRPYLDLVHPDDRDRLADRFRTELEAGTFTGRDEYRLWTADGEWRDVETVGNNLLEDPFVDGVVLNTRDVTERREHEREIRRKNAQLEQFAGVVSHDLRNPLSVAQGYLEAARAEVDSEHHEDIAIAHDRMEAIIDDVLLLAREGRAIGETDRIDLERAVDRAWANVDTAAASLAVAVDRPLVADGERLVRLLENLFRNAIDHGGEDVRVRVGTTADGFFVADDGPGIPADERDAVLEYGYSTAASGTGFGLAIVHRIADGHGWSLRLAESDAGGVRFEFDTDGRRRTDAPDGGRGSNASSGGRNADPVDR